MECKECSAEYPWHVEGCTAEMRMLDKAIQREREGLCLFCGLEKHDILLCKAK